MIPVHFEGDQNSNRVRISANRIGWLHSVADKGGAQFDLTIKDARGGIKFQRSFTGADDGRAGELINLPTGIGEEVEVVVENIKGAKKVDIFFN